MFHSFILFLALFSAYLLVDSFKLVKYGGNLGWPGIYEDLDNFIDKRVTLGVGRIVFLIASMVPFNFSIWVLIGDLSASSFQVTPLLIIAALIVFFAPEIANQMDLGKKGMYLFAVAGVILQVLSFLLPQSFNIFDVVPASLILVVLAALGLTLFQRTKKGLVWDI